MSVCSVDDCERTARARTWCTLHYQRWSAHGDPTALRPLRRDTLVDVPHGTPQGYNYYKCRCDECAAWKFSYARADMLKKQYGMSADEYDAMLAAQGSACAICERQWVPGQKYFSVDHCHDSGAVRGILCNPCNQALGLFGDDVDVLVVAINYLRANRTGSVG